MSCVCGTLALRILQHWARMGSKSPILKARFIGLEGRSNYGHLTVADLPTGTHDIHSLLNHDGVLPKDERNKAALRLMSWCTFRMPDPLRELLARLGDACAQPNTEDGDLVLPASRHGAMVETAGELKAGLTGQLHCWVGQHHLQNYQGVVGSLLMDLALPITIYLLDYFLPQLAPTEHCVEYT